MLGFIRVRVCAVCSRMDCKSASINTLCHMQATLSFQCKPYNLFVGLEGANVCRCQQSQSLTAQHSNSCNQHYLTAQDTKASTEHARHHVKGWLEAQTLGSTTSCRTKVCAVQRVPALTRWGSTTHNLELTVDPQGLTQWPAAAGNTMCWLAWPKSQAHELCVAPCHRSHAPASALQHLLVRCRKSRGRPPPTVARHQLGTCPPHSCVQTQESTAP